MKRTWNHTGPKSRLCHDLPKRHLDRDWVYADRLWPGLISAHALLVVLQEALEQLIQALLKSLVVFWTFRQGLEN